ncbi:MAG: FkbM family methyltransferase [Steroidobacterales bacterium]
MTSALGSPETFGTVYNDQLALRLAVRLCDPTGIFVDVGAHIGSVSAAVLRRHPRSRVIAIEAIPEKAEHLKRKFPEVDVRSCAVAARPGKAAFFVDVARSGYSSLLPAENGRQIEVELSRLDDLLPSEEVSVVKIDVEGAELGVLLGADAVTKRSRPVFVFESAPTAMDDKPGIWQWFSERDYALCIPERVPHYDDGLALDCFLDSHLFPRRATNYVALPRERRLELRSRARASLKLVA